MRACMHACVYAYWSDRQGSPYVRSPKTVPCKAQKTRTNNNNTIRRGSGTKKSLLKQFMQLWWLGSLGTGVFWPYSDKLQSPSSSSSRSIYIWECVRTSCFYHFSLLLHTTLKHASIFEPRDTTFTLFDKISPTDRHLNRKQKQQPNF